MNPYSNNHNNNNNPNSNIDRSTQAAQLPPLPLPGPSRMQNQPGGSGPPHRHGMDSNYPQHTQAPLPHHYASSSFNSFGMPASSFSASDAAPYGSSSGYHPRASFHPPQTLPLPSQYSQRLPPQRGTSPPGYDRFAGYPGPVSQGGPPYISVSSPDVRKTEIIPEMGDRQRPPHSQPQPDPSISRPRTMENEPRMGQYMSYNHNQPHTATYGWPTIPQPSGPDVQNDGRGPAGSRRSTLSRTTDDEAVPGGFSGTEPTSEAGASRPTSPVKPTQTQKLKASAPKPQKVEEVEEEDADEEKIDHRKRKRNRTIRSCVPCHNHKRKCDRKRPCGRCTALGLTGTCVYEVDEVRDMNDPEVIETDRLRKRIAELEQVVRELRQKNPNRVSNAPPALSSTTTPAAASTVPFMSTPDIDGENKGQKRRVIVDRFARFKIDEAAMAAVASAAAAGNDHNTSPKSGDSRRSSTTYEGHPLDTVTGKKDYKAEPYGTYLLPGEEMVYDRIGRKTFLGAAAGKSMLRRLTSTTPQGMAGGDQDLLIVPEDAAFTGVFPDTRKTFPFTTIWSHENFSGEIIGLLPNQEQSQILFDSWREEVCSFFLAWHLPTLEADYKKFFAMSTSERMNVPLSSLALFLMICSLGCVMRASRSEIFGYPDRIPLKDGKPPPRDPKDLTSSRLQSELYLSGAYQALRLCSFLSNPSIHTIQAQIMINVYLLNSERASDAWAQTGSLVRQCIAMGLHVDPASLDPRISIRDAEVRRRMWWTVAGLDALLCLSFGRPSVIHFYKTNLPQDREDETLSDAPGTAVSVLPPSNVLNNETTEVTYHAAYYQLAIPSYELLDRLFHVDKGYSRSAIYGWFRPDPEYTQPSDGDEGNTYEGALRLANDIVTWYSHLPRGMRFVRAEDTAESLLVTTSYRRINQRLALCVKTFMIVLVLHRPYLRADPTAYPESAELCLEACMMLLDAYRVGSRAEASIFWSWWTMSYRAFHAGAVCAFLAIRQPGTDLAQQCITAVKGAIDVLNDRMLTWNSSHPVQGDLCAGLIKLHDLAKAATQQKTSPVNKTHDRNRLSINWAPNTNDTPVSNTSVPVQNASLLAPGVDLFPGMPLSQIRGFPDAASPNPVAVSGGEIVRQPSPLLMPQPFQAPEALVMNGGDGFGGSESLALPQFWASMFGIKMEGDTVPPAMSG